jgi:hypothetical protein
MLMQAILHDRLPIAKIVNATVIKLDDAPQGSAGRGKTEYCAGLLQMLYSACSRSVRYANVDCIECKQVNSSTSSYCSKCGAQLGRTLDATIRKRGFTDRNASEAEITEAVLERLLKYSRYFAAVIGVPLAISGFLLGKYWFDLHQIAEASKTQIRQQAEAEKNEVLAAKTQIDDIHTELDSVQHDIERFQQVNKSINSLQIQLQTVQGQVLELRNKDVTVRTLSTNGPGPSMFSFGRSGCPAAAPPGSTVSFCADGVPLTLYSIYQDGTKRPVASLSTVGFHEASQSPKPTCDEDRKGTLFVEKGGLGVPDKPWLCLHRADNSDRWVLLNISE